MKRVVIAVVVVVVLVFAGTANSATTCKTVVTHTPAKHWVWVKLTRKVHGRRVAVHYHGIVVYRRVRRPYVRVERERVCTVTVEAPAPTFRATATVGSFVASTQNPLAGKITYGVSITRTANGDTTPDTEAEGILMLYAAGRLMCPINVSGATSTAECPVTFAEPGEYPVTVTYFGASGEGGGTISETVKVGA